MSHFFAQMADYAQIATQVGWPGLVLWLVVRALDRIEHSLKGLSKALWMDLASRNHGDPYIKSVAQREIDRMEAKNEDRK